VPPSLTPARRGL